MSTFTEPTYHMTKEDLRKAESKVSKAHGGQTPADSDPSAAKSIIESKTTKPKDEIIAERQANLPLPEQPPQPSDWNSADARTVNVGSGRDVADDISYGKGSSGLRGPATGDSSVRTDGEVWKTNTAPDGGVGRQGKDGLDGLPEDALAK